MKYMNTEIVYRYRIYIVQSTESNNNVKVQNVCYIHC